MEEQLNITQHDMRLLRGDTYNRIVYVPADLTGYAARMHVRRLLGDIAPLAELTSANNRIAITPNVTWTDPQTEETVTGSKLDLSLEADLTQQFPLGSLVYDLEISIITDGEKRVRTILRGTFIVQGDATQ